MVTLFVLGVAVFAYSLISRRLSSTPISAPMFFVGVGIITGGIASIEDVDREVIGLAVEATLALLLFSDAARIDLRALRRWESYPTRLLTVGLPLTLVLGALIAKGVFPDLLMAEALLLAAAVAPTDAALGEAVVSDARLPVRIRQALNVESGLNDGIVVPVVTVALALAAADEGGGSFVSVAFSQIGWGVVVGAALGYVGRLLLHTFNERGWVSANYRQLGVFALIIMTYALAVHVGGSGFIAAYVGGAVFGWAEREDGEEVVGFAESEGQVLSNITFLLFGAVMVREVWGHLDLRILIFVLLALSVMRMIPVWIAMLGTRTIIETKLFMGWFGPRGLATILFALQIEHGLPGSTGELITDTIVWTVLFSVILHGVTANPWVAHLARTLRDSPKGAPELHTVGELPTRTGLPATAEGVDIEH